MALCPDLTSVETERVYLNSLRSCFTILSNITVYCLAFMLLNSASSSMNTELGPSDVTSFFHLAIISTLVGLLFAIIFLVGTPESQAREKSKYYERLEWYQWFLRARFYQTALCTRIIGLILVAN